MNPPSEASSRARVELAAALADVEKLAATGQRPTRFHARAILIPLGRFVLEEGEQRSRELFERLESAVGPIRESWERAVRDELTIACTEHVQGVDPRHLNHPRFDYEYIVAARERLEARLAAASCLELPPPEDLLDKVAAADRLLEPHLRTNRPHRD